MIIATYSNAATKQAMIQLKLRLSQVRWRKMLDENMTVSRSRSEPSNPKVCMET